MALKVAVNGAAGRMGKQVVKAAAEDADCEVVAALEATGHPAMDRDAGVLAGLGQINVPISGELDVDADVLIDFSVPESAVARTLDAAEEGAAVVIGTTGLSEQQLDSIRSDAAERIPVLVAPNMGIGMNLMFTILERTARAIASEWDVEITEVHHNQKTDAPSGTALKLADIVAEQIGRDLSDIACYGRQGEVGKRTDDEIGIHAVRAGDVPGTHTVTFGGPGEVIELTHRATDRTVFAKGAIQAAKFLSGQEPGMFSMEDVLS